MHANSCSCSTTSYNVMILYYVKVFILLHYLCFADSLQRWLTHSRARHRLMTSPRSFIRPSSMLKCVLSLSVQMLLFMLLVVAGDVERNPGPHGKEVTTCIVVYIYIYIVYHSPPNSYMLY